METEYPSLKLTKKDLQLIKDQQGSQLQEDLDDVMKAIELFVNSKVSQSERICRAKYGKTLLHTHATGIIGMLKALMTFDRLDIDFAMDALRNSVEVASTLRKELSLTSTFSDMLFGGSKNSKTSNLANMTAIERHAEITFAEAYLIKAFLSIVTDSNMVAFVKEGMAIRQSYSIYKSCYKFLVNIVEEEGQDGLLKHGLDSTFITAVYLGIGGFNLLLSILPAKVLRIFEFIGFSGNRDFGMACLSIGANWPEEDSSSPIRQATMKKVRSIKAVNFFSSAIPVEKNLGSRKFICDVVLNLYHVMLSTMIQLPGCNIPLATKIVGECLTKHEDSFIYLIIRGKISQSERNLERAIAEFSRVITVQKDWKQLAHVCYWDIGISYAALGEYSKAADCFSTLYKDNEWSKSIYLYLNAVLLYTADPIGNIIVVSDMLKKVPNHLKKIAGKSIPLEKFVARKARKFASQKNRLQFPVLEILYMWNGFDLIPEAQLNLILVDLNSALIHLDKLQQEAKQKGLERPYSSFYDDLCLVRFFKGLVKRELAIPSASLLVPEKDLIAQKITKEQEEQLEYAAKQLEFIALQADEIEFDHWILPFARYELGALFLRFKKYDKARNEFQAALNGGYQDDEAGKQKHKASMESSLHLRIHNAVQKLNYLEALIGEGIYRDTDDQLDQED